MVAAAGVGHVNDAAPQLMINASSDARGVNTDRNPSANRTKHRRKMTPPNTHSRQADR